MKGFLLGLVVAGLGFAGYHYLKPYLHPAEKTPATADAGAPPKEAREKKKKRRRGAVSVARNEAAGQGAGPGRPAPGEADPEPIKLSPADLKPVSQGDDLSRPDVIHMGDAT